MALQLRLSTRESFFGVRLLDYAAAYRTGYEGFTTIPASRTKKSKAIWRSITNATRQARHCPGIMPDMPCAQPGPN